MEDGAEVIWKNVKGAWSRFLSYSFYFRLLKALSFKIGREKVLYWQNHGHDKTDNDNFRAFDDNFIQFKIDLKNVSPTFFKFTQTQSVLFIFFSNFAHPCPFLAFLCFF